MVRNCFHCPGNHLSARLIDQGRRRLDRNLTLVLIQNISGVPQGPAILLRGTLSVRKPTVP
jgi:hypothetical protein